ncbi:MAG: hypothetical protein ACJAU0_000818 [Flavobacteriales bacterium]|jgi:hypothetical protein
MRKTYNLFFLGHRTIVLLAFLFASSVLFAQDTANTDYLVVHISDIDAYSYGDLARSIKGNDQVSITEACIPASLVAFQISEANTRSTEENVIYIKSLIVSATELHTVNFKEGYSEIELRSNCGLARKGLLSE